VGLTEQHEQEVDDSDNSLLCHGVQWKVVDGVLEDWRCMPRFGAHILWGNDVDEMRRTPFDYWMLSFPSHMLTDISNWTSDRLPEGCEKVNEGEILAVFGALYSLTRTSEGIDEICGPLRMVFFLLLVLGSDMACHEIALKFYLDAYHSALKMRITVINGHQFAA
jgi:hypothetical protein